MKTLKALSFLAAGAMLLASFDAFAMGPHGPRPGMGPGMRLIKLLNLTPAQERQAIRIRAKMQEDLVEVRDQIMAKHEELRKLWAQEEPDIDQIKAKFDELVPLHRKVFERRARMRLEFRNILTREQKDKLMELLKTRPRFMNEDGFPTAPGRGFGKHRRGRR